MYQGRRKKGGGEGAIPSDLLDKNPISIGWEADYAHQITTPLGFSNLPTALYNVQFLIN